MNRRSFFKFLPIAPVALAIEGAKAATKDLAPYADQPSLQLTSAVPRPQKPKSRWDYDVVLGSDWSHGSKSVKMCVGRDGDLWLKSNGCDWKKVLTE